MLMSCAEGEVGNVEGETEVMVAAAGGGGGASVTVTFAKSLKIIFPSLSLIRATYWPSVAADAVKV